MKLQITSREIPQGRIYETNILGTTLTLSRALVEKLKAEGNLKRVITAADDWIITAQTKERNGRTYTNLYLTCLKPKTDAAPAASAGAGGDLPF